MKNSIKVVLLLLVGWQVAWAQSTQVVDIPTRPGVTQRFVLITPDHPRAAIILFAGGHGGLRITPEGKFRWGAGNFLVRSRKQFAAQGLTVAVVDAPSDRQKDPYLTGFRQTPQHVQDIRAVIAWLRQKSDLPVWLVGTSNGTKSVAYIATQLPRAKGGPDGIVLTSTILKDPDHRAVLDMALSDISVPVLVVHHKYDDCPLCPPALLGQLMNKLSASPRKQLVLVTGGVERGNPCMPYAHHGFNDVESKVVKKIALWITQPAGKV